MDIECSRKRIPWAMACLRVLLGPVFALGARCGWNGWTLAVIVATALASDIFDGVLARRWKCDTARLRLFDSSADAVFYVCVLLTVRLHFAGAWQAYRWGLVAVVLGEAANHGAALVKFGRPASYHSYLAKTWGLVLACAVLLLVFTGTAGWTMSAAIAMGLACNAEGVLMTLLLPRWQRDVKSLSEAMRRQSRWIALSWEQRAPQFQPRLP